MPSATAVHTIAPRAATAIDPAYAPLFSLLAGFAGARHTNNAITTTETRKSRMFSPWEQIIG